MNEFLEQFLIESRELIEQATDDLLALEETPGAGDRLDSAFRSFHTLKGAAGIMEFEPMARALHAAEDTLAAARSGAERVTPALIGDCLTCLDQVLQWLETMEGSGAPPPTASREAELIVRRFARAPAAAIDSPPGADAGVSWPDALASGRGEGVKNAAFAVRYTPAADSFFQGADPVGLFIAAPGLAVLDIHPTSAWPDLASFDPFTAQISLEALFDEEPAGLLQAIRDQGGDPEVVRLPARAPAESGLSPERSELLRAQAAMLRASLDDGLAGRVGSATRVVVNVLRTAGRPDDAEAFEHLGAAPADAAGLAAAIDQLLAGRWERDAADETLELEAEARATPDAVARSLRVDVERIDALVSLTGELTVAKNAFGHAAALANSGGDTRPLASLLRIQHGELERLVRELQHAVLNMRVLPMRHVFQRFPRLVREMVVALGKPARLVTEGDATEADKTIVETLFEPLLHVLRNALDHGVEDAEARRAAGKPPSATITLSARNEGDHVIVEVADDGAGVDLERVKATAAARGLATLEALDAMSPGEITSLIFAPGFSTAAEVTSISGRGVGMDAVRSSIERLGGRVTVESERGAGTQVRFTLPFTVMMSRVMTVEAGGQTFGVPLEAVLETVRLPRASIVPIGGARAFVLRDRTVPVIDLAEALGTKSASAVPAAEANLVVAAIGGAMGALEVDRLGERLDVMLKPLDGLLAGMPGVAGTTLLGDGRVLLVLDLAEVLT